MSAKLGKCDIWCQYLSTPARECFFMLRYHDTIKNTFFQNEENHSSKKLFIILVFFEFTYEHNLLISTPCM